MSKFLTLDDVDVKGRTVLVRADLNVPMANGQVSDATRITRFAPTAHELAERGAKVVVLSHFGRPKAQEKEFSLAPLVDDLSRAIGLPMQFAPDCIGPVAEKAVAKLQPGQVLLLENVRFHAGEEKNDLAFVAALAQLGDLYVNDAFSAAHRRHASTAEIALHLPAVAGRLMQAELDALHRALEAPQRPVLAIVGGSKVSTKLDLLQNLVSKVDALAIGGAMANTFLLALGHEVGESLVERGLTETATAIMAAADAAGCRIILPVDVVTATTLEAGAATITTEASHIPANAMALDVGPATVALLEVELARVQTVVWNGPLGAFEYKPFDAATVAVAKALAAATRQRGVVTVAGGGDTVAALEAAQVASQLTYVSSAGGAFLEWLEGRELPGVAALEKAAKRK